MGQRRTVRIIWTIIVIIGVISMLFFTILPLFTGVR